MKNKEITEFYSVNMQCGCGVNSDSKADDSCKQYHYRTERIRHKSNSERSLPVSCLKYQKTLALSGDKQTNTKQKSNAVSNNTNDFLSLYFLPEKQQEYGCNHMYKYRSKYKVCYHISKS